MHLAQAQLNDWSFVVLSRFKAALSPPTGVLRRDSSASSLPVGDDFFRSAEEKDDDDWDTDLEMDGEMNARLTILFSAEQKSVFSFIYVMEAWNNCCAMKPNYHQVAVHFWVKDTWLYISV